MIRSKQNFQLPEWLFDLSQSVTLSFYAYIHLNFSGQCKHGWINHDEECYFFSRDALLWTGAMEMCRIHGGYLVEVDNEMEEKFIENIINVFRYDFWLGASDTIVEGEWVWETSGTVISQSSYKKWGHNQPDNHGPENCLALHHGGTWTDELCSLMKHYICESKARYNETEG
ncbi:hypothetical protein ACJMK2_005165 [Sinanodonta woodiana]|uniref:C-type lectin domain-containing protein n=1 Tax=Sinanodonta woodiana TaxID=1069815 RepID=A0ABD3VRV1_SINWO